MRITPQTLICVLAVAATPCAASPALDQKALHALGNDLWMHSNWPAAARVYEKLVAATPSNSQYQLRYVAALEREPNLKGAITAGQNAVKALPKDAELHFQLAYLQDMAGERDKACAEYDSSYQLSPHVTKYITGKVRSLSLRNKPQEAMAILRKELQLNQANQVLWESLAEASLDANDGESTRSAVYGLITAATTGGSTLEFPQKTILHLGWRLISLDQWDRESYKCMLRITRLLDEPMIALEVLSHASKKFNTDPAFFRELDSTLATAPLPGRKSKVEVGWEACHDKCMHLAKLARASTTSLESHPSFR